jgi:hypothetical protein
LPQPFIAPSRTSRSSLSRQIGRLAEMAADDAAARLTLADTLLTLAAARVPAGTLGAGGTAAAQRISAHCRHAVAARL